MGSFTHKMLEIAQSDKERKRLRTCAKGLDPEFPTNGCASLMSCLIEHTLLAVGRKDDFDGHARVIDLAGYLKARGWQRVELGQQQAGDIAITRNDPNTGRPAHTFLLVSKNATNGDRWLILDNQAQNIHERSLTGQDGKTATAYFLRTGA